MSIVVERTKEIIFMGDILITGDLSFLDTIQYLSFFKVEIKLNMVEALGFRTMVRAHLLMKALRMNAWQTQTESYPNFLGLADFFVKIFVS